MTSRSPAPRTTRAKLLHCAAAALLSTFTGALCAQERFGLAPEAFAVYQRWLLATCIGGEERSLEADLHRYASVLAPAFQQSIAQGPTPDESRAVGAAAATRYAHRSKFPLEQFRVTGVSKEDLDRFRRVTQQDFVDDQVKRFVLGYKAAAIAGLGVIGNNESRALLVRIAANGDDPLALAAREALRRARPTP